MKALLKPPDGTRASAMVPDIQDHGEGRPLPKSQGHKSKGDCKTTTEKHSLAKKKKSKSVSVIAYFLFKWSSVIQLIQFWPYTQKGLIFIIFVLFLKRGFSVSNYKQRPLK